MLMVDGIGPDIVPVTVVISSDILPAKVNVGFSFELKKSADLR